MNKLQDKIKTLSTDELKTVAYDLSADFRDGAHEVFAAVLKELEYRMGEPEYVEFCEGLG